MTATTGQFMQANRRPKGDPNMALVLVTRLMLQKVLSYQHRGRIVAIGLPRWGRETAYDVNQVRPRTENTTARRERSPGCDESISSQAARPRQ